VLYVYNVAGWSHSKKQIRDALDDAYTAGFDIYETPAGHRWGYLECGKCGQRGTVWSTPKSPDNHAKQLRRFMQRHRHDDAEGEAKDDDELRVHHEAEPGSD
jgi:hypothetical protein